MTKIKNGDKHDQIKLMALDLPIGHKSSHLVCPFCRGGHTSERSFIIIRNNGCLWFKCYRAKCSKTGVIRSRSNGMVNKNKEFTPKLYEYNTTDLSTEHINKFLTKYQLSKYQLLCNRVRYSPERDSFVFPIMTIEGFECGVIDRSFSRIPKVITYWHNDVPHLHFPQQGMFKIEKGVIIVEDVISAIKLQSCTNKGVVCILGTHLGEREALYLSDFTDKLIFCLDADAVHKAYNLKNEYSLLFNDIQVMYLENDVKDTPTSELINTFYVK